MREYLGGHSEDDLLGEFAQTGFDVTGRSVAVTGKDVTPVSLTVDQKAFLAELYEGSEDGRVTVRVVLHRLADDVGHLSVASVVHSEHGVKHTSLHRFESVNDVWDGPLQNDV